MYHPDTYISWIGRREKSRPPAMEKVGQLAKQWNVPFVSDGQWQANTA